MPQGASAASSPTLRPRRHGRDAARRPRYKTDDAVTMSRYTRDARPRIPMPVAPEAVVSGAGQSGSAAVIQNGDPDPATPGTAAEEAKRRSPRRRDADHLSRHHPARGDDDLGAARHGPRLHARGAVDRILDRGSRGHALFGQAAPAGRQ